MEAVNRPADWGDPFRFDFAGLTSTHITNFPFPSTIDIGKTLMFGSGAVGSNILYFMSFFKWHGSIYINDFDMVKILNLNRSLLQMKDDVGTNKALCGAQYLSRLGFNATALTGSHKDFFADREMSADLIVPTANEENIRWDLANNYPPLMIYGTTDSNWGAYLGRHIPLLEECLACRFPNQVTEEHMACAKTQLSRNNSNEPDAALPFLSALAALLAVAEIVKLQLPGYPFHGGRMNINLSGQPQSQQPYRALPKRLCGACMSRRSEVFYALRGHHRWSRLSKFI
jgi:ThiF family